MEVKDIIAGNPGGGGSWAVCGTQVAVPILVYTGTPLRSPLLAALFI